MKVYEFYTDESKWAQEASAKDINGIRCNPDDAIATSFCLARAIKICYPSLDERTKIQEKIISKIENNITTWNDEAGRTFDEVKQLALELNI